jgi:Xaa-Pro aminopeptidase
LKNDLNRVMAEHKLDALWVTGPAQHNPCMTYFTGLANVTHADLIVRRGKAPILYHFPMEREEAARTGLVCRDYNTFDLNQILRDAGGDRLRAGAARMARVFADQEVYGRVAVLGKVESGPFVALVDAMRRTIQDVELVGEEDPPLLMEIRATKSADEIDRIRAIGKISTAVLADTADFLSSHSIRNMILEQKDGTPLRVGDAKNRIRRKLAELGGEMPEGLIFAAGRDGAIPHSTGTDTDVLRAGIPIVFDFFPQEAGGGYFYDITRTWCIGFAPEEVARAHAQVLAAYLASVEMARAGIPCRQLQQHVCERFEADGHPTVWHTPQTERGYVHSLGHGVGLDIHERPILSDAEGNRDTFAPGMVFTIEPGLYYPERAFGIRLEDTLWMDPGGIAHVLAPYPMDLVLPAKHHSVLKKHAGKSVVSATPTKSTRAKKVRR